MRRIPITLIVAALAAAGARAGRVQDIEADIAKSGGNADLYGELGTAYYESAEFKRAEDAFKTALTYTPSDGYLHYRLAEAYFAAGDLRPAITCYREALACDPAPARAYYQMGQAYLALGDNAAAAVAFAAYLKTAPADFNTLWYLGQAYENDRLYDQALEAYNLIVDYSTGPFAAAGEIGVFGTVEDLKKHIKKIEKKVD